MPQLKSSHVVRCKAEKDDEDSEENDVEVMEYDKLLEEGEKDTFKTDPLCNPVRFTLTSLSLLVFFLISALSVLLTRKELSGCPSDLSKPNTTWLSVNMITDVPQLKMGIIADIHLLDNPKLQCHKFSSKYGAIGCDVTESLLNVTLDDMYQRLHEETSSQGLPFIIFLGDASWHFTRSDVQKDTDHVLQLNQRVFGLLRDRLKEIPVIATLGNNDFPIKESLNVSEFYPKVLEKYRKLADIPGISIPAPDFDTTFNRGGYFSVKLLKPRIRIVSLNTLYFTTSVSDRHQRDYANEQLEWIEKTLSTLEKDEKVVFIGHHPPGVSLYYLYKKKGAVGQWNTLYIERFQKIHETYGSQIIADFFGHCHTDIYNFRSDNMVAFTAPSVSPVYGGQPSYQIAILDEVSRDLRDVITFHTWLDYYTRTKTVPLFHPDKSYRDILSVERLSVDALANSTDKILDEKSSFRVHTNLKAKMYQAQFTPPLNPHLHYCFTKSILNSAFLNCLEEFGFNVKQYVLNGYRNKR